MQLAINGSYWIGVGFGAIFALIFLRITDINIDISWRLPLCFAAVIGIIIIIIRCFLPESPRWLLTHKRVQEAENIISRIEDGIQKRGYTLAPVTEICTITIKNISLLEVVKLMIGSYLTRALFSLSLMISQAFFYNAIFFTYSLILIHFYNVPPNIIGFFLLPFAAGNFLGSLLLGPLFDRIGRKPMISSTYAISATLLILAGILFLLGWLNAVTQTLLWSIIFVVSSASASSAYLTIAEIFPVHIRAICIALFHSVGTAGGGLVGPILFGFLIESKSKLNLFIGYCIGAGLMYIAAICTIFWGVEAEGKSLESLTQQTNIELKQLDQSQ